MPAAIFAQAPTANFSASKTAGCSPVVVQFSDLSTGTPTSWHWDLGNGGTSTLQNPAATYITPGSYRVILTATNGSGSTKDTNFITVHTSPTVAFTSDTVTACGSKTVTFTNQTIPGAGGATSYLWDFGDGDSSTALSPTHTYTYVGNFAVSLVAINSSGCTNSLTKNNHIKIIGKPVTAFTANQTSSCNAPFQVTFSNTTTNATSFSWSFGDGNTSTATNPVHTYTASGSYTVRLISTGVNGCKDTLTKTAYIVIGQVNAGFTATSPVCAGKAVSFTNTTTPGPGTTRIWTFGTGSTTDTSVNPNFTYPLAGSYNVTLIEMYANNCNDTVVQTITVNANPTAQFTTSDTVGCAVPFTANFTNSSTGATSYAWSFGSGTSTAINPSFIYNALGIYNVSLIATNASGCKDTVTRNNYIKLQAPVGTLTATPTATCINSNVQFTSSVAAPLYATNYRWDFGDGSSIVNCASCSTQSHAYTGTGTYNVQLIITTATGCFDTIQQTITISAKPTANFTGTPLTICPDATVNFTNTSTGATSYNWSFGDGFSAVTTNPGHTYDNTGTYNVTLIASNNGCRDTLTRTAYVTVNLPKAEFEPTFQCSATLSYTFLDSSIGANVYSWDFGDGNTSTTSGTVTHTYATAGTYSVQLRVTNTASGCIDTMTKLVNAAAIVVPAFSVTDSTICKGQILTISRPAGPSNYTYAWYLGTLLNTNQGNFPQYVCGVPGTFDLKLVVTDSNGCKDSVVKSNFIKVGGTTANFSASNVNPCKEVPILFDDISSSGPFTIANRYWDFGDGVQVNTATDTITHKFNNPGPYNIKMVLTDANGCKDSITKNSYVYAHKPTAQFYTNDTIICAGDTVQFQNNSGGTNFTSFWNLGDGNTSTNIIPAHIYNTVGNYTVKLTVTDAYGCKDSATKTDYIKVQQPDAIFTLSDTFAACPPLTIYANNTSTNSSSYAWTFGNNNQSSFVNPSTTYTYPGVYTVKLVATNVAGCKDSATKTVTLNGPTGTYSYTPLAGCNPLQVQFTAVSNNTALYIWDMNNGVTANTNTGSYSYTFTQTGKYVPKLILSDGAACQVPLQNTDTITVDELNVDFNFTSLGNLCNNDTVYFNDTITQTQSAVTTRSWTFGDGNTSSAQDPSHFYSTPGTYQVRLIVTNTTGCKDTVIKTVVVRGLPIVVINTTTDSICPGQPTGAQLTATGAATYAWTPATGLSCTNCANPTANPQSHTTYIVTGTDTNGCMNYDTLTIGVKPKPIITVSNDTSICQGNTVSLLASGAATYVWSPSAGLSCASCANPVASPVATISHTVIGTNTSGCKDTADVTITVLTKPVVDAGTNKTICIGDSVIIKATGAEIYAWSPSGTLSCASCDSTYAKPTTTTGYTVIGTLSNGCKDTAGVTVNVNPQPVVSGGSNKAICIGSSTSLQATGASSYVWSPAIGLSCTNCANPTANPTTTTVYTVIGTNGNGCKDTATVMVTVNPLPTVSAGPDKTTCIGFGTPLQATGAVSYTWTPVNGLSCTNCANPTATPTTTTVYTVTGTDANGCIDTGVVTVTVNPQPIVSGGTNQNICPGDTAQLQATGAITYAWSPATGLSCTSCANPKASPSATTTYTVVGTDANSCKDTATVTVNMNSVPVVSAGNNVTICVGSNTTLQATGATTYVWSPVAGLSCTNCANPTANPITTTIYTVIGSNVSGCKDTATVTVTVNPSPAVSAGSDKTVCVGFGTSLQATGAVSYTWTPATGLSCTNCASPTATPTTTTVYTVTGTDANGCIDTGMVTVTVNPQPIVSGGTNQNICPGDTAQLQATGGVTYAWSPATGLSCTSCTNPKASPSVTTTYTVIGTDANGCKDTATATVNMNSVPVVSAGNNVAICIGSSTALQATGAASYTWSPATGLSCTNCANPTANPTTTTTYTVIGTNGSSCKDTATITVTVNPLPSVSAGTDKTVCIGFGASLQATGAVSYTWSPAAGLSCTNCSNPTATPVVTSIYIVSGTDANGCIDTSKVTVNVNAQPLVGSDGNKTICLNDSVQLQGSGAVTYAWSPTAGLSCVSCANPKASPAATTTYTVVGTDANGCKDTATAIVSVNPLPVIGAGANKTICLGSNVQLNATGGVSYTWSPSTGLSCTNCANPVANPTTTTIYTITGTDANGCKNTGQITVNVNPLPTVSAGSNQSVCLKDSAQLLAIGASTYTWSPSAGLSCTNCANPKASPAATTTYTVTGTNANGCVNTSTVTVTIKPLPVVNAGNDATICLGNTTALQATGASSYVWSPSTGLSCTNCANPVANPTVTSTYIVTGTGANACIAKDTVIVTVNSLPVVTTSANQAICAGDSVQLQASGTISYSWTPTTGLSCANCPAPMAGPANNTTYIVTGTDNNSCTDTAHITVTVKPLPIVTVIAARALICDGDTTMLSATGAANYSWTPGGTLTCTNCPNPIANPQTNTTYTVVGNTNGCTDTATVTVDTRAKPNVSAGADVAYCTGSSSSLQATGALSYVWSPAGGLSCTNCINPTVNTTVTTVYTVTGTDNNGCVNTDNVTATVHALPPVNAGEDKTVCEGDSVQLTATGAVTYTWSPATGLSCINCADPFATTTAASVFSVTGVDENGCINTDDVTLTAILRKPVTFSKDDSICLGEQVNLFATGGTDYIWSPTEGLSNPFAENTVAAPTVTTKYMVLVKQGDCFTDTGYANIKVFDLPEINAGPDKNLNGSNEVKITTEGKGIDKYEWTPADELSCADCPNPVITPKQTATYKVKVTSPDGCTAEDDVTVFVTCGTDQIFIANTFTPNNDGVNDRFFPQGRGVNELKRFSVYNRWGELIFDRQNIPLNDPNYGWDGTYKTEPLKPDVFVYIIRAMCDNGTPIEIKGDISLVR